MAKKKVEPFCGGVAERLAEARKAAGLTQKELAKTVGTRQAVISQLESRAYRGHSLSMLVRVAEALNRRVEVRLVSNGDEAPSKSRDTNPFPDATLVDLLHETQQRKARAELRAMNLRSGLYGLLGIAAGKVKRRIQQLIDRDSQAQNGSS